MPERKRWNLFSEMNVESLLDLVKRGIRTKGFIYVTVGNLVNAALGGLFYLLCARILSVTSYGYISYYLALGFFVGSVSILGLSTTVTTFYPKEARDSLVREATLLTFLVGLATGFVASLYVFFFPAPAGSNTVYSFQTSLQWLVGGVDFIFMLPLILGIVFYYMTLAVALGRRRYRRFAVIVSVVRVVQLGLVAFFYLFSAFSGYFLGDLEKLMLVAYVSPFFLVSLDYFRSLFSVDRASLRFAEVRAKLTFTLHTWGMNLAQASRTVLDKIIVGLFFGLMFLGTYNLAFQFLLIFLIVPQSLLSYLLPEKAGGSVRREVEVIGLVAAVVITVFGIFLAPYFIRWLFPHFTDSIPATQVISLAVVPASVANIRASALLSEERTKIVLAGYVSALAVDVLGILSLGPSFQAVGFAAAFMLSQVVLAIILVVLPSERFANLINRRKPVVRTERTNHG